VDTIRPSADAEGVQLGIALDPTIGRVAGDPDRVQQIAWNLLSNAVKFTPAGGRVEVRLDRADTQARMIVRDTGQGIAKDFLPHIFDRFRQAERAATRGHGGLGLGLVIVRHLVELHGGSVSAENADGDSGAIFTVSLPLSPFAPSAPPLEPIAAQGVSSTDLPRLGGVRVLVVDDEADTRDLLRLILEKRGAEVVTAGSAREALALLEEYEPNVLVSDLRMPEKDGYSFVRELRTKEHLRHMPAVAVTAYYSGLEDQNVVLAAGYQARLAKPVEADGLVAAVAELASRRVNRH